MIYLLVALFLVLLTIASYIDRLYSEMGKFLSRDFQQNIDIWEERIEPRLGLSREHIALSATLLAQLSLAAFTLALCVLLFDRGGHPARPTVGEIGEAALGVVLAVVFCNRLVPFVFFTRTRGAWLVRWAWLVRACLYIFFPVTLAVSFLLSIVSFASLLELGKDEETTGAGVNMLIEAGQDEGILEEEDHALIRSAVEFGDKVVSEVMTPRPRIFAVPGSVTVAQLLVLLQDNPFSRVPCFAASLDDITGIVFAHDLLQISDLDAETVSAGSIARPATFVPENKRANEALREMQREKQHMRIVIDEYGGVAGLVTIEDLVEEIVGTIADEHESEDAEAVREEAPGQWSIPGSLELSRLEELVSGWSAPEDYEATTVAGLVSEAAGRIPMAGEVVEQSGLRFEILSSTDRKIERMRVSRLENAA